jgi:NodT family efflux transporter outer membrane factor (OMF) lipoprotein
MKNFSTAFALSSTLVLGACATVGVDYHSPEIKISNEFQEMRRSAGLSPETPVALAAWWKTLNDPTLDMLIEKAVGRNLDIRAAAARLRQARAERGLTNGNRFPTLSGSGSAQRVGTSSSSASGGATANAYSMGFDAGWELDLFGGIQRSNEAAEASLQASAAAQRDVLVTVLAEVSLNYVELRSFQTRLSIAEKNLASQQSAFDLIESQQEAGLVEELDLQRSRSNVESTRAQLPSLATSVEQARNRLATLLGQPAGSIDSLLAGSLPVPTPPIEVAIGVPADMLRRRPDIRRAERQLAAATARVGVATAELYPKLSLNGSIGLESLSSGNLLEQASRTFGIGSVISWRLFEGGKIRSQIAVQGALQEQALIAWESAVLNATEEVENALTAYANEQLRYHSLEKSAQAATRAAELARSRYDAGLSTFLGVLDSDRSRLAAEDALAVSNAQITSNLIKLYKALGGGWQSLLPDAPLPQAAELDQKSR